MTTQITLSYIKITNFKLVVINYGLINKKSVFIKQGRMYETSTYNTRGIICDPNELTEASVLENTVNDLIQDEDFDVNVSAVGDMLVIDSQYIDIPEEDD